MKSLFVETIPVLINQDLELFQVTYLSQGLRVKGFYGYPNRTGSFPGLLYCRGGIKKYGMVSKERVMTLIHRGFVVLAPFYRGNEGGEGYEDFAGDDRLDVFSALEIMKELPEVQAESVTLIGFSRGAMMAMLTAKECEGMKAVVVWGGVSDLLYTYQERVDLRKMLKRVVGHPEKQRAAYIARSPIHWVDQIHVPVLIVHGELDEQVSVEHAYRLSEALKMCSANVQLNIYERWGHRLPDDQEKVVLDDMVNWINELS